MIWWHSNQRRLSKEKAAIAALEVASDWLENVEWSIDDQLRLRAIFDICLGHRKIPLTDHVSQYVSKLPAERRTR